MGNVSSSHHLYFNFARGFILGNPQLFFKFFKNPLFCANIMSLEDIVITYGDTTLFKEDVDLLKEGRWLNDKIIAFYLEYDVWILFLLCVLYLQDI